MLVLEIAPLPSIKTGAPEEEVSWSISLMFAAVAKKSKSICYNFVGFRKMSDTVTAKRSLNRKFF